MADGIIRQGDVVLNPRVIQEVSRALSISRSVVERAGIPSVGTNLIDFKKSFRIGTSGQVDKTLNGIADPSKISKKNGEVIIQFPKQTYMIDEQAKATAMNLKDEIEANTENIAEYFRSNRDYYGLNAYHTAVNSSAAATALWTASTAKIEEDIVAGITSFLSGTDYNMETDRISVIVPAAALSGALKLDMIGNVQQRISDWLGGTYNLQFFPYTPRTINGTAGDDALGNDAIMFIQGIKTGRVFNYTPPAGTAKMYEYSRVVGTGDLYSHKDGVAGFVEWDGQGTWTSATNYKSKRIYKITGVKS